MESVSSDRLNNSNTSLGTNEGDNIHDALDVQAQEVYERFVRSVFCDENGDDEANFTKSFASCTDEDDEEEYEPQTRDDTNDDDCDDEDDEDEDEDEEEEDIEKIGKDEVKDLMEGVYQTLAGEIPIPIHLGPFSPTHGNEESDYTGGTGSQSGASGLTAQYDKSNPSNASFSLASGASMESPSNLSVSERSSPRKLVSRSPTKRKLEGSDSGGPYSPLASNRKSDLISDAQGGSPKKIQKVKDVTFADHAQTFSSASCAGVSDNFISNPPATSSSLAIFGGRSSIPTDNPPIPPLALDNDAAMEEGRTRYIAPQRGSLLARLVSQLFSKDTKEHDLLIEGMPVGTIRKLVARQISMGLQLLVQLMLLSPEGSDTFNRCYESFLELSNCRQTSLKKIALMRMNLETFKDFESLQRRQQSGEVEGGDMRPPRQSSRLNTRTTFRPTSPPRSLELKDPSSNEINVRTAETRSSLDSIAISINKCIGVSAADNSGPLPSTARMTRSRAVKSTEGQASGSVLDLRPLAQLDSLFECMDHARRAMSADKIGTSRGALLGALQAQTRDLLSKIGCRRFECLAPTHEFPLPEEDMLRLGPSSLVGRLFFTPAEDDLLLRGCVAHGDGQWGTIKDEYLRSKAEPALLHRFNQMIESFEENKFRQYQRLCEGYRARDLSWTLSEDLSLLQGFMVHGESWPLIQIFFLPQRPVKDLVQRWNHLQLLCVDESDRQAHINSNDNPEFPATVSDFIRHLQAGGPAGIGASRGIEVERKGAVIVVEGAGAGQTNMSGGSGNSTASSRGSEAGGSGVDNLMATKHLPQQAPPNATVQVDSADKKKRKRVSEPVQSQSTLEAPGNAPAIFAQLPPHPLQSQVPSGTLLDLQQLQQLQQLQMQSVQMQLNGMSTMSRLIMNLLPGAIDPTQLQSLQQMASPAGSMAKSTANLHIQRVALPPPIQQQAPVSASAGVEDDVDSDQMDDSDDDDTPINRKIESVNPVNVVRARAPDTLHPQVELPTPLLPSSISSNGLFASVMARVDKEQGARK